jgi:hypothetical protein
MEMSQQKDIKPYPYEQQIIKELERAFPAIKHDWLPIVRFIKQRLCAECVFKERME